MRNSPMLASLPKPKWFDFINKINISLFLRWAGDFLILCVFKGSCLLDENGLEIGIHSKLIGHVLREQLIKGISKFAAVDDVSHSVGDT